MASLRDGSADARSAAAERLFNKAAVDESARLRTTSMGVVQPLVGLLWFLPSERIKHCRGPVFPLIGAIRGHLLVRGIRNRKQPFSVVLKDALEAVCWLDFFMYPCIARSAYSYDRGDLLAVKASYWLQSKCLSST